jgi:diadenosine tetraphosphate (Ap4A) HIT family hydrolase
MTDPSCPFCKPDPGRIIFENQHVLALWDAFPVTDGHALIVPRRHVASWFDTAPEEQNEIVAALSRAKEKIEQERAPDGYNMGMNDGEAAGQTVGHLHVHIIPRYEGDVADPRGGIRWVIPERAPYWDDD